MAEKLLKVGIIGCGGISHQHTGSYKQMPDRVEVVACCDIDEAKCKAYAEHFNIPHTYTDCREMMKNEQLDLVSVCTWNAAHKDCTIAALEGGANVICEKPMAMNQIEAQEMLETAKRTGKMLQIGFVRRFGNDAEVIKRFIDAGDLGDIYYAKCTYLRRNGCPGGWFGYKELSGGGPLIDLGVHVMDLCRYLSGRPKPVSAFGCTFNKLGKARATGGQSWVATTKEKYPYTVEDMVSAMIRFDNGMVLSVEASFNLDIKKDSGSIELFGSKGGAKVEPEMELYTQRNGTFINIQPAELGSAFSGMFMNEIRGFVDAAEGKVPCRAPAEDGVILMKMIDAIYESAKTGHEALITY